MTDTQTGDRQELDPVADMDTMLGNLLAQWEEQGLTPVQAADALRYGIEFTFSMRNEADAQREPSIEEWLELARLLEWQASRIRSECKRSEAN